VARRRTRPLAAKAVSKKANKTDTRNLTDFLLRIATDSSAFAVFKQDPDGAMDAAGLTAAQKSAVKSKDPKKLSAAVLAEFGVQAAAAHVWPVCIVLMDF
jgi:hypothetical protein